MDRTKFILLSMAKLLLFSCSCFAETKLNIPFSPYADFTIQDDGAINLIAISQKTKVKSFHLAFIVDKNNCQPFWGQNHSFDSTWGVSLLSKMRKASLNYTLSFGGPNDNDLSSKCSVEQLVTTYEKIISLYHPVGLDFDIEHPSVVISKIITALKILQPRHPLLKLSFTLPVVPTGLNESGVEVVKSAKAAALNFSINIMAMNYGEYHKNNSMGELAAQAANSVHAFLKTIYPAYSDMAVWKKIEITPMIGLNIIPDEVFSLADVDFLRNFATEKNVGGLSMWSINRDHPCSDSKVSATCTGNNLQTRDYEFTEKFLQ